MDDLAPRIRELLRRARDLDQEADGLRQRAAKLLRTGMANVPTTTRRETESDSP